MRARESETGQQLIHNIERQRTVVQKDKTRNRQKRAAVSVGKRKCGTCNTPKTYVHSPKYES